MEKIVLIIIDGWGLRDVSFGNAIRQAKTPNFDRFWHQYPRAVLQAAGQAVGLPSGQMGTSEVNHMTIGAGRIIFQDLVRINKSIEDKSFFKNKAIITAFNHVKNNNSTLHVKGLLSPGGVHSHQDHLYALLKAAKLYQIKDVYIHVFTDGRDTPPKSALHYVKQLEEKIKEIGVGKIASVSGRFYAMDRDHNWERTDKTFHLLTKGKGERAKSALEAIEKSYQQGEDDEFVEPTLIEVGPGEEGTVASGDAVVFINFRTDRPRQLTERFLQKGPQDLKYITFTQYSPDYQVRAAFPPFTIKKTLGEVVSQAGLKQLRVTETEKFAHLTFFMNCKRELPFEGEDRIMLDSYSDIKTHDQKPEMRTPDVVGEIVQAVQAQSHPVIFTNLCNPDMVGHTGNLQAAIKAVEVVDQAIGKIVDQAKNKHFNVIITADHGNAEEMIDSKTKEKLTAHTTNPVPFILISDHWQKLIKDKGGLADIAPTILKILGLKKPKKMSGQSLV